ncbi:MAG: ubiquinone biosynthesis regulatory protein kinase UbiB, partial [Rhodanobacteraceae bacterium]
MTPLRQVPRIARIAILLVRYRLDELIDAAHLYRPLKLVRLFLPRVRAAVAGLPRGARLTLALTECGPIFVKFGQILSTRRDLLPADVADELTRLQDQVAPFPAAIARTAVERALGAPLASRYAQFD